MTRCYLGLGSNLAEPAKQLQAALELLHEQTDLVVIQCSSFYGSKAVGPGEQPDYLNAVVAIDCDLPAAKLLQLIQAIEHRQGRQREIAWGARTLDIDLLLFGNETIETESLTIPHPRIAERAFVLAPLVELLKEIEPELRFPDGTCPFTALDCLPSNLVWLHSAAPSLELQP